MRKQKGFALLTVLLVVALVTMVMSELLYNQHVQIKRSAYMIHQAHSMSVAYGFEGWVKKGLAADLRSNKVDHLKEQWAQKLVPIDFEGGLVSGEMVDLQSRLNLNNVLEADENKRKFWQKVIERHLAIALKSDQVVRDFSGFADILTDWVDENDEPGDYGAESSTYLLKQPAYRAANQPLVMVSELQNLETMDKLAEWELDTLKTQVTALPKVTAINVNTVNKQVLLALTEWMTEEIVQQWLVQREVEPVTKVEDFINFLIDQTGFDKAEIENDLPEGVLSVTSDYFQLQAQIDYGEIRQLVYSIFHRQSEQKVVLVQRWLGYA